MDGMVLTDADADADANADSTEPRVTPVVA